MSTNLITIKDVQEKSRDGSSWLEVIDQNDLTHRIFRRIQDNEGNWHDLSDKYEMLKTSRNQTIKITTEQKGRFTNVVDIESVAVRTPSEPVSRKTPEDKEAECKLKTFTVSYAKDLAVAGIIQPENILGWSEVFYRYLQGDITVSDTELPDFAKNIAESKPSASGTRPAKKPANARYLQSVSP